VLLLRIAFAAAATAVCIWLLKTGNPVGGLVIAPAAAVWMRRRFLSAV
jgi:hypothetical protein